MEGLRYGIRSLRRDPKYTLLALLVLALGIGALATVFGVVHAVLFRPLPFKDAHRIARIWAHTPQEGNVHASVPTLDYLSVVDQARNFEAVAAYRAKLAYLTGILEPQALQGSEISSAFFSVFSSQPAFGRCFLPEEFNPGADRVIILSHRVWQRDLGGRGDILGSSVTLNADVYTVVGIGAADFSYPQGSSDFWLPLVVSTEDAKQSRAADKQIIAKLGSGATLEQAQLELNGLETVRGRARGLRVVSLRDAYVGGVRPVLFMLLGAAGLLFLIACANLGNLTLVRAIGRHREFAIQMVLGAGRLRILRQFVMESLVIALAAGLLGVLASKWGIQLLRFFASGSVPRVEEARLDIAVVLLGAAASLVAALLSGMLAALTPPRKDLYAHLHGGSGRQPAATGLFGRNRPQTVFVALELALAMVLLTVSGLFLRSFNRLTSVDLGFNPRSLLTLWISLPRSRYPTVEKQTAFFREVLDGVRALPSVEAAGVSFNEFFSGSTRTHFRLEGQDAGISATVEFRVVSAGFLQAVGVPLRKGRYFADRDSPGALPVAIVNGAMDQSLNGILHRQIFILGRWHEVVGVVGNVRDIFSRAQAEPTVYLPYFAHPSSTTMLAVRTAVSPELLAPMVRQQVYQVDKDQPVMRVGTVERRIAEIVAEPRLRAFTVGLFAGFGYILAILGVYGVTSHTVTCRLRDLGIRMALGAQSGDIYRHIVGKSVAIAAVGLIIGLGCVLATARLLSGLLYGIEPVDALSLVTAALVLCGSAALASYLPARRAVRLNPLEVLREE